MKLPKPVSTEVVKPALFQVGCAFCCAASAECSANAQRECRTCRAGAQARTGRISGAQPLRAILVVLFGGCLFAQNADAQSILPPAQGAIGGGNPLQGLGRSDDPSPSRYKDFAPKNLQDTFSSGSGSGLSSDLLKSLDNADGATTDSLNKLLSPDALKSLTGSEGDGSSTDGLGGGGGGGLQSNSPEFTDKAGSSFSEQLQGSNVGDLPPVETESSDQSSFQESSRTPGKGGLYGGGLSSEAPNSSLSKTGSDDGPEGLPPEPAGLAAPIKAPSLSVPLSSKSLSSVPDKAETAKTTKQSKTPPASDSAATRGARGEHEAAPNRKASPLSTSVSDRIRQALEARGRTAKPKNTEPAEQAEHMPPPDLKLVPAPPPGPVEPAGPTPERHALALMKVGNYHLAERQLRELVETDGNNLHARYLFAVALVYNKKYDEAKNNYGIIIRKAQDKRLVEMAESGLQKLMH